MDSLFSPELAGLGYFRELDSNKEGEADWFLSQGSPLWAWRKIWNWQNPESNAENICLFNVWFLFQLYLNITQ